MWVGQKMIVEVTTQDGMLDLKKNGVGNGHLRRDLWVRFGKICCQGSINDLDLGGTVKFKFKMRYKLQRASQQTTLGHFKIYLLTRALIVECRAMFKPLSS